jgi:hypothetical protein
MELALSGLIDIQKRLISAELTAKERGSFNVM